MPKIVINEWDKTKAGSSDYSNFAVVVPGIVKERTPINGKYYYGGMVVSEEAEAESVFDENGVYECSSRSEFLEVIGKCPYKDIITVKAVAPVLNPICAEEDAYDVLRPRLMRNTAWTNEEREAQEAEHMDDEEPIPAYKETAAEEFERFRTDYYDTFYYAELNPKAGDIGLLKDDMYIYKLVGDKLVTDFDLNTQLFTIIDDGDEGVNEEKGEHYGNQIAYELLGLGYTVLYKLVTEESELSNPTFWSPLKDKAMYDFRYVITGLLNGNESANAEIIVLADYVNGKTESFDDIKTDNGRGDCIALVDISDVNYKDKNQEAALTSIIDAVNNTPASKYAAFFAPSVTYKMADSLVGSEGDESSEKPAGTFCGNKTFPASFHYLACAAKAFENFSEWYAVAGYTRGVSNYTIDYVACKLGESAIDVLEPRNYKGSGYPDKAVNLIVKIKTNYLLWGNRTAYKLGDPNDTLNGDLRASHFLNIRQLCSTLKKQIYVACRRFTFDPNSDLLWINFCNAIRPTLERMKGDQGISDYKFIKVKDSKKALLTAKIRIVPIEAVEDFNINVYLEDSINGVVAGVSEEDADVE